MKNTKRTGCLNNYRKPLLPLLCYFILATSTIQAADINNINGGIWHFGAVDSTGAVWTWGANSAGQLGDGTNQSSDYPVRVIDPTHPSGYLYDMTRIDGGNGSGAVYESHTTALKQDGTVWSWGWNAYGQLGDGTVLPRKTPVKVTNLTGISAIDAGRNHSLALQSPAGIVWGWGQNDVGQLGNGDIDDTQATPISVTSLTEVTATAAGEGHGLAVKSDTSVWAWGNGAWGALGDSVTWFGANYLPVQVQDAGGNLTGVTSVAAGDSFSVALKSDGTVWTWGNNDKGQLGDGTNTEKNIAVQVLCPLESAGKLTGITSIAAGGQHVLARKSDGSLWSWGKNSNGQLGINSTIDSNVAVQVLDPGDSTGKLTNVIAIGAGRDASFAAKADGSAWGWGANFASQIGVGGGADKLLPMQILFTDKTNRLFELLGPYFITPGEAVHYVVRYKNVTNNVMEDTIALVELPQTLSYVESGSNGIYWPTRRQVFWKLGNLQPGGTGVLSLEVTVDWGLEPHTLSDLRADISARGLSSSIDIDEYLAYEDVQIIEKRQLSPSEIDVIIANNQSFAENIEYAKSFGYLDFGIAYHIELSDGHAFSVLVLLDMSTMTPVFVYDTDGESHVEERRRDEFLLYDASGGYGLSTTEYQYKAWGAWAVSNSPSIATCVHNCGLVEVPDFLTYVMQPEKWEANEYSAVCSLCALSILTSDRNDPNPEYCGMCLQGTLNYWTPENAPINNYHQVSLCRYRCQLDSNFYSCELGDVKNYCINPADLGIGDMPHKRSVSFVCKKSKEGWTQYNIITASMETCKDGPCINGLCQSNACAINQQSSYDVRSEITYCAPNERICENEVRTAHDPNEKSVDVAGDVLPGHLLNYTVDYENVGASTAYQVFILDQLDEDLDADSLQIKNGGSYVDSAQTLNWSIGTLAAGEQGSVSFNVNVETDLVAGSEIINIADIYFPSAGEITPTNAVVNRVASILAEPQKVQTIGRTPVVIDLYGKDTLGSSLAYTITSTPLFGKLTGTSPNLLYTAMPEFNGLDELYFTSSNALLTSEPARVTIIVEPDEADSNPPEVVSTWPASDAVGIHAGTTPIITDPDLYKPVISARFSETLDRTSVTDVSFALDGVSGIVGYDELSRSVMLGPKSPLASATTYTARLSTDITDKAGNHLEAEYSWQFTTAGPANITVSLPDPSIGKIDLRQVPRGSLSDTRVVTISSTGTSDLDIEAITLDGDHAADFDIVDDDCSHTSLESGFHCTFGVNLQPAEAGIREAILSIASDDPVVSEYQVAVTGLGVTPYCSGDKVTISTSPGTGLVICYATESITTSGSINILPDAEVHFVAPATGLNGLFRVQPRGEFHSGRRYMP